MNVGERIRVRRKALGMSQTELARRVDVTQSTIAGLERGDARSSSHLHRIARALQTTPAFLAGETADPFADSPDQPELTPDQREWLGYFDALTPADRAALLHVARSMNGIAGPSKQVLHAPKPAYRGERVAS